VSDWLMTCIASGIALAAVWFPLYRGMRLCYEAREATRVMEPGELQQRLRDRPLGGMDEPLGLQMLRALAKSLKENRAGHPREFIVDATRQYIVNDYDTHFAARISMYANLLPPIGFIGTTGGLLILFVSMHMSDSSLELGALAIALTSSIFALIGFSLLEGMKLRLYTRLLESVDAVIALERRAEQRQAA